MMRRSSRASDHSIYNFKEDDDLEDFVRLVGSNQELSMFQNSSSESSSIKKGSITHFQNLRDTHNSLSDSLSSSMMIGHSQHDHQSSISPVSSTSSTGRSYQPIIPSPLHAEQKKKSTSPVHIPQSFPQLRSLTNMNQNNALRISRIPLTQNEQDADDMFTYSTYPQDQHHQDLHMLRNTATAKSSQRILGRATVNEKTAVERYEDSLQRSRNTDGSSLMMQDNSTDINSSSGQERTHSMMDDDDSLVFKMSELECEGPSLNQQQKQPMVFNHRFNNEGINNEHYLELTATPLSPPLLHRLQSMSTVAEEEEKGLSASGSSHKSDSPKVKPINQQQHPFDAW